MIFKLPVTSLFSRLVPSGIMILLPSFATMMHVPARRTPLPNQTSPETVRWSSSVMFGMDLNRFSKFCVHDQQDFGSGVKHFRKTLTATFLKWSPSFTTGVPPNSLDLSIVRTPCSRLYNFDLINSRSLRRSQPRRHRAPLTEHARARFDG